jgi:hypothetical protein
MTAAGIRALSSIRPRIGRIWRARRTVGARTAAVTDLAGMVRDLPVLPGLPDPRLWSVREVLETETDVTVALFGTAQTGPLVVGRILEPSRDAASLRRNHDVLSALRADPRLSGLAALLPEPIARGEHGGRAFAVERAVPGVPARTRMHRDHARSRILDGSATAIDVLHGATGRPAVVDENLLERWVGGPVETLRTVRPSRGPDALSRLTGELRSALVGQPCSVSWCHGDYWVGNILLDGGECIAGIVDWDAARPDGLPLVDLVHLILTTRAVAERIHLGTAVNQVLDGRPWSTLEDGLLTRAGSTLPATPGHRRAAVLLAWLGHVGTVLTKRPAYGCERKWPAQNVDAVLSRF